MPDVPLPSHDQPASGWKLSPFWRDRVEELSCFECRRLGYAVFEGLGLDCNVGADSSLGQGFVTLWFKFLYSFGLNYSDDSIPDVQVKDRF